MAEDTPSKAEMLAFMDRLERTQSALATVAERIMGALEIHNEKLDAILEAATQEAGPSPVAEAMEKIVAALNGQERLLLAIPHELAKAMRAEMQREVADDVEADPEAFEEAIPGEGFSDDEERQH